MMITTKPTTDLHAALAALPLYGGTSPAADANYGINTTGDVLVNQTADGVSLAQLWDEVVALFSIVNTERLSIVNLMSYWHTQTGDAVPQSLGSPDFEPASELGVPKSVGPPANALLLGYTFKDLDLASRFSWRFLRDASAEQVRATIASIVEADNRLVSGTIMRRLFDPAAEHNEWNHTCFGLWNDDGIAPPPWLGRTFDDTHTHYIPTQAAQIDSDDLEAGFRHITEHGYGTKETGAQLLVLANPDESEFIQGFRAGVESRTGGPKARFDYIPSVSAPPYLSPDFIVGQPAPAIFNGLPVLGSYGPAFLIESNFVPSGYVAVISTSGPGNLGNTIGVRQHVNPAYQGLRQIPGPWTGYPIIESFSVRSFGVGTRHRGAAVALQVTTATTYTAPPKQAFGLP